MQAIAIIRLAYENTTTTTAKIYSAFIKFTVDRGRDKKNKERMDTTNSL